MVVGTGGVLAIGWTGLHYGIIHQGITANLTLDAQVNILAGTGALQFLFGTVILRLYQKSFISRVEALVLNAAITAANNIVDFFLDIWDKT